MPADTNSLPQAAQKTGRRGSRSEALPHLREGLRAGLVGASVVALFFLVFDAVESRPLATPNALGAALFLGDPLDSTRPLSAPLILGYTAAHGTVFVGIAGIFAALLFGARQRRATPAVMLSTWAGLFVACELFFLALTLVTQFSVWGALGAGRVAIANLLAAAGMTASLRYGLHRVTAAGETR